MNEKASDAFGKRCPSSTVATRYRAPVLRPVNCTTSFTAVLSSNLGEVHLRSRKPEGAFKQGSIIGLWRYRRLPVPDGIKAFRGAGDGDPGLLCPPFDFAR